VGIAGGRETAMNRLVIHSLAALAAVLVSVPAVHAQDAADGDLLLTCGAAFKVSAEQVAAAGDTVNAAVATMFSERLFINADTALTAAGKSKAERAEARSAAETTIAALMASGGKPDVSSDECLARMVVPDPVMSDLTEQHMTCGAWFSLRAELEVANPAEAQRLQALAAPLLERAGGLLLGDGFAGESLEQFGNDFTTELGQKLIAGQAPAYTEKQCIALIG
jgi:hypothetical protein